MKLSPQKEIIVSTLRDLKWHCGREWLDRIKDDRKRVQELNEGYMLEKGYVITGEPCKGSVCRRNSCPLFKRRAIRRGLTTNPEPAQCISCIHNKDNLQAFETYQPNTV